MTDTKRHWLLLRYQLQVLAIVLVAGVVWAGITGISQYQDHQHITNTSQAADNRAHFWRTVAGEEKLNSPLVAARLAGELHAQLGSTDSSATALPDVIERFRGTSNSYGGITKALGDYDVFDESGLSCDECGPYNNDMKSKLLQIKQGNVESAIASEQVAPAPGYTLTPFGWSALAAILFVWLIGGPLMLLAAYNWVRSREGYHYGRFGDLGWSTNGECDSTKLASIGLAVSYMVPFLLWRRHRRHQLDQAVRTAYPNETAELDIIYRDLDLLSLHHGDDDEVVLIRNQATAASAELVRLTKASQPGDVNDGLYDLRGRLSGVQDALEARRQGMAELDADGSQTSLGQ